MAETDILNPINWQQQGFEFNPNPSYGFAVQSGDQTQTFKPRAGQWYSRDLSNDGHQFTLGWIGVPLFIKQRVLQFYHSFKHGYFTFIDVDDRCRQYVGRFTSPPKVTHTANGKYNIEAVPFEEVPTARMLVYPSDTVHDGHVQNVADDFLKPLVAFMVGSWVVNTSIMPSTPPNANNQIPRFTMGFDETPVAGDWAQTQYFGFGFTWTFPVQALLGVVNVFLDGVEIVTSLDLSLGTAAAAAANVQVAQRLLAGQPVVEIAYFAVPLDLHRLQLYYAGANAAAVAAGSPAGNTPESPIVFPPITYLY